VILNNTGLSLPSPTPLLSLCCDVRMCCARMFTVFCCDCDEYRNVYSVVTLHAILLVTHVFTYSMLQMRGGL
jgi:hypothetical protein